MLTADVFIDGQQVETVQLPTNLTARRYAPFWRYELPQGKHTVRLKIRNPAPGAFVTLDRAVVYANAPKRPPV